MSSVRRVGWVCYSACPSASNPKDSYLGPRKGSCKWNRVETQRAVSPQTSTVWHQPGEQPNRLCHGRVGWWERELAPWEGVASQLSGDAWAVWVRTGQWQLSGALVALAIHFFPGESPEQGWKEITVRELLKETSHLRTGQADQYPSIKFLSLGSQNKSLFGNRIITDIRHGDVRVNP